MAITKLVISGADSKTISLAHKAESTSVVPDDNITATNVQSALEQLDDIKAPKASPTFTGTVTASSLAATALDVTGTIVGDGLTISSATANVADLRRANNTGAGQILLGNSDGYARLSGTNGSFDIFNSGNTAQRFGIANNGDISFYEDTGADAKLFWDASEESLGIGTDSPLADLHVSNGTNSDSTPVEFIIGGTANSVRTGSIVKGTTSGAYDLTLQTSNHATQNQPLIIKLSDATEAMRIDSSGNVLVSKTSTAFGTAGSVSYATGLLTATVDDNACVQLNRLTSDGVIQTFGKDGTTVGSIGIQSSGFYIDGEASHLGLRFGSNSIVPRLNGLDSDNTADLGESGIRFQDLHLSGTGYFGTGVAIGTTSPSSKLDVLTTGTTAETVAQFGNGSITGGLQVQTNGNLEWGLNAKNERSITLSTNQIERMRIDSSGNVGIAEANPQTKLHVDGKTTLNNTYSYGADNYHIRLTSDNGNNNSSYISNISSNNRMNISTGGYYYGSSTYQLTDGATGMGALDIGDDGTLKYTSTSSQTADSIVTPTERMRIDSSGHVLIGTTISSGFASNVKKVVGGVFTTLRDSTDVANNTATTVATLPTGEGNYMVSASLDNSNNPAHYNEIALVGVSQGSASITVLKNASHLSLSMSGRSLQVTHNQGATQTIHFSILRML